MYIKLYLMEGYEDFNKKLLVLHFKWQSKSINDTSQDLQ